MISHKKTDTILENLRQIVYNRKKYIPYLLYTSKPIREGGYRAVALTCLSPRDCMNVVRKFSLAPLPRVIFMRFSHENREIRVTS